MYRRYYDGYQRMPQSSQKGEIIVPEDIPVAKECSETEVSVASKPETVLADCQNKGSVFPFSLELDDIILIGILLFLLLDRDECKDDDGNDIFILLIIGFILFADIF